MDGKESEKVGILVRLHKSQTCLDRLELNAYLILETGKLSLNFLPRNPRKFPKTMEEIAEAGVPAGRKSEAYSAGARLEFEPPLARYVVRFEEELDLPRWIIGSAIDLLGKARREKGISILH